MLTHILIMFQMKKELKEITQLKIYLLRIKT
jgi:hypothetical protein